MVLNVTSSANNFLTLAGKNDAKLIAKIIFEINYASVGIDMFRSFTTDVNDDYVWDIGSDKFD